MLASIQRILYASDLGEGSRPAFRYAVNEAIQHGAEIIFLHAVEPISELTEDLIEDYLPKSMSERHSEQLMLARKERIRQRLESFVSSELDEGVTLPKPALIKVSIGQPDKVILAKAEELEADMIVMGDRESHALTRLFLGSTAQKVIHQSKVPVMIIPLKKN